MLNVTITTATNETLTTKEVKSISAMWNVLREVRDTNEAPNGLISTTTDEAGNVVNKVQFVLTKAGKIQFKDISNGEKVEAPKATPAPKKEAAPKKAAKKAASIPQRKTWKYLGNPFYNPTTGKSDINYFNSAAK